MRVPEERRSVPAPFLASFITDFSDSKCQMAVAVLHRVRMHRYIAETLSMSASESSERPIPQLL